MQMDKRWIARRIGQVIMASSLVVLCCATAWGRPMISRGSGIVGNVSEGPIMPVCQINVPCTRPFVNAPILVLNAANRNVVRSTKTNRRGNFRVAVAPGSYLVHVQVIDFPRCPEVPATVRRHRLTHVQVACRTGIF